MTDIYGLHDLRFGEDDTLPDWREVPDSDDPNDEPLTKTPSDVTAILGFDPVAEF